MQQAGIYIGGCTPPKSSSARAPRNLGDRTAFYSAMRSSSVVGTRGTRTGVGPAGGCPPSRRQPEPHVRRLFFDVPIVALRLDRLLPLMINEHIRILLDADEDDSVLHLARQSNRAVASSRHTSFLRQHGRCFRCRCEGVHAWCLAKSHLPYARQFYAARSTYRCCDDRDCTHDVASKATA